MFSASCGPAVGLRQLGQLIADAVPAAEWPIGAVITRLEPQPDEMLAVHRFAWRTGQVPIERAALYLAALYAAPGEGRKGAAELQLMAFEAAAAAVATAFGSQVSMSCVPVVTLDMLQSLWMTGRDYFCTAVPTSAGPAAF
ncbi:hypothetical protein DMP23_43045 [Amycolatopsis sp. A1MSW2902]